MAVTFNTSPPTVPVVGAETTVVSIVPGLPLDNLSVYFVGGLGGGGGLLELALYTTVGGVLTRVAQAQVAGSATPSIIAWQTVGRGASQTEILNLGGTAYTVTVQDLSSGLPPPGSPPRGPITVTIAGVDQFDTAPDANFAGPAALPPGTTFTLPVFAGYAQQMDVAISQQNLPPVLVSVSADCGPGSVQAVVAEVQMSGVDDTIAAVFQELRLPVATRYFVSVENISNVNVGLTLAAITDSVSVTAGGVVILNGDVIGPSNANTVIKWDNVPLLLGAAPGFGAPVDAAIPIFDAGLGEWRTFALSGGATMNDAGVVTINPATVITLGGDAVGPSNNNVVERWETVPLDPVTMGAPGLGDIPVFTAGVPNHWVATPPGSIVITLAGNANGPSNNNTVQYFPTSTTDADINVGLQPHPHGLIYEGFNGLTATRNGLLNAAPTAGDVVIWKDEDGSLAGQNFVVNGNGKLIDGAATFTMTAANVGAQGSITVLYTGTAWAIV
jgi:hypothetical protein